MKKLNAVSLSNNTVSRQIQDMPTQVQSNLINSVKKSPHFALQLDESTDIANYVQLFVYKTCKGV